MNDHTDNYGNPLTEDGDIIELLYCCFPDCGCDGSRLCMAKNGASSCACALNMERGVKPQPYVYIPPPLDPFRAQLTTDDWELLKQLKVKP